jgi:tetratricopeptide (TPR) repeat protein
VSRVRRRAGRLAAAGLLAGALAACGAEAPGPEHPPEVWRRSGDVRAEERDWPLAARDYGYAFRLLRPRPELARERAAIAALVGATLLEAGEPDRAQVWLDKAIALEPREARAWYERGRLHDLPDEPHADPGAALHAYRMAVALAPAEPDPAWAARLAHAGARVAALERR